MRWGWGCFVNLFASFAAFSGTGGQSYASYYQYAHPYNPYLAPGPSFTVTITQATSTVPTRTTATNSNTAPGGPLPSKAYYGIDGSVCDTRTALAFIGCPCMIVGKACADSSSVCAVPSTGRKKRFAARGRSRASIGGNTCVCKPSYAYDSGSKMCLATATPTTAPNPCPPSLFCNTPPTESTYLEGPFQQFQTLLLFVGNCVVEYKEDFTNGQLIVQTAPQTIASYVGQAGFTGPVDLAYNTLTAGPPTIINANLDNRVMSTQLSCTTDPSKSTGGLRCPSAASAAGATQPLTSATSASSQIYLGNPRGQEINHYVVLPDNKELALYNTGFTVPYSKTTGLLTKLSPITQITAIQIMQDEEMVSPSVFAVYGTNKDGVAYIAYLDASLFTGKPELLLSDSSLFPITVVRSPQLLRNQFKGQFTCPSSP